MGHEIINGDFKWKDERKNAVSFKKTTEIGRFNIKIWKPNFIQRILIKLKIMKDPRYNGNKKDFYIMDEIGHWKDQKHYYNDTWKAKK